MSAGPSTSMATMATTSTTSTSMSSTTSTTGEPSTSTASPTGEPTGGTTTTTTTTTDAEPDTSTTSTTGEERGCAVVPDDHGDCDNLLGWAFDGVECTRRFGCDCAPDCDKFFDEGAVCARDCAYAGFCDEHPIVGWGAVSGPVAVGQACDDIRFCDLPGLMSGWSLGFLFPFIEYSELFGPPCTMGGGAIGWDKGDAIGDEEWTLLCAASLLPGLGSAWCIVEE